MASGKTNSMETDLLSLYFNNVDHPNIGDAAGLQNSVTVGNFYISLHNTTLTDGESATQVTNEVTTGEYAQYGRQAVPRTTAGWTVASNQAKNAAAITYTEMASGSGVTIHAVIIGQNSSGAGDANWWGELNTNLVMGNGVTPEFAANALIIQEE